jgi:phosphohistidine phosphatase
VKRLIVVRHAKSDWSLPGQEDWDRPLNPRGQRDAPAMARRLRSRRLKPDRILSSPAVRALTTATVMARELRVAPALLQSVERLYLATPVDVLAVVRELGGAARHLMVVGHNPGITEFANRLSGGETIDNMPTCAVFTARFDIAAWDRLDWGQGEDSEFDYPRRPA